MFETDSSSGATEETLPHFLQGYLQRHLLKVAPFARQCGVDRTTMSRIVHGRAVPEPDTCRAIARVVGQPPQRILRLAGHLPPLELQTTLAELGLADENLNEAGLALQLRGLGDLELDEIVFLRDYLNHEIQARQERQASGQPAARPRWALRSSTAPEGGAETVDVGEGN